jgi:hypothetical protein
MKGERMIHRLVEAIFGLFTQRRFAQVLVGTRLRLMLNCLAMTALTMCQVVASIALYEIGFYRGKWSAPGYPISEAFDGFLWLLCFVGMLWLAIIVCSVLIPIFAFVALRTILVEGDCSVASGSEKMSHEQNEAYKPCDLQQP